MSVEVEDLCYINPSGPRDWKARKKPRPFRQNALHDLESFWWVAIWMLFSLVRPSEPILPNHHRNYNEVFGYSGRQRFWSNDGIYNRFTTQFPAGSDLADIMYDWKQCLVDCYLKSYDNELYVDVDVDIINEAHEALKKALGLLCEDTQGYPLELKCLEDFRPVFAKLEEPPSVPVESSEETESSFTSGEPDVRLVLYPKSHNTY